MAMEQIVDEYKEKGYELKVQYPLSHNLRADLYAVKDDEKIAIEFVNGTTPEDSFIGWIFLTSAPYVGYILAVWVTPYIAITRVFYYERLSGHISEVRAL